VDEPTLQRARALVLAHGWNATAYQILNPGIRLWFATAGDAVAGYVKGARFWVIAGAPVCAEARLAEARAELEAAAAVEACGVVYFGAESRLEAQLRNSPVHAQVLLGAQPAFSPQDWPAMLNSHASLRAQLRRAVNKSVRVAEWPARRAESDLELRGCLYEWLATRGLPPLHFLVEPETLGGLFDRRVIVATRAGRVVGFLVAAPIPGKRGWLIEQIIRGRGAVNGTAELLIDAALRAFAVEGGRYVTLGLSPLSQHAQSVLDPWWLRWLLAWMRAHANRFYNFAGLDAFKAKFRPARWEPIYAICNRPRFTPGALYAVAEAFTGGRPFRTGFRALGWAFAREVGWI
jgi:phosphatidylglycerol lysyltransferase